VNRWRIEESQGKGRGRKKKEERRCNIEWSMRYFYQSDRKEYCRSVQRWLTSTWVSLGLWTPLLCGVSSLFQQHQHAESLLMKHPQATIRKENLLYYIELILRELIILYRTYPQYEKSSLPVACLTSLLAYRGLALVKPVFRACFVHVWRARSVSFRPQEYVRRSCALPTAPHNPFCWGF
jgi:hypothetical protein